MGYPRARIVEVNRPHPLGVVKPTDFTCEAAGQIELAELIESPSYSLYCFDLEAQEAVFVELPDPAAVDRAAFYYQAQATEARAVVRLPMGAFHNAASRFPEAGDQTILIHSVGRCGSTLLSKVFGAFPSIYSLSEPDDLTQLVSLRVADGVSKQWIGQAMVSSVRWRLKPHAGSPTQTLALKTRSEVLVLADLIADSFPLAKHLFLYRDGIDWMRSVYRGWPSDRDPYNPEVCEQVQTSWVRTIPRVGEFLRDGVVLNALETRIQAWITCMEGYLFLRERGLATCAVNYGDLVSNPKEILSQLFEFCDLRNGDWSEIDSVLGRDSQAGTFFDREERSKLNLKLTDRMIEDIRTCIATRPNLLVPEALLPGTLSSAALETGILSKE